MWKLFNPLQSSSAITITGSVVSCMKLELRPRDTRQINWMKKRADPLRKKEQPESKGKTYLHFIFFVI